MKRWAFAFGFVFVILSMALTAVVAFAFKDTEVKSGNYLSDTKGSELHTKNGKHQLEAQIDFNAIEKPVVHTPMDRVFGQLSNTEPAQEADTRNQTSTLRGRKLNYLRGTMLHLDLQLNVIGTVTKESFDAACLEADLNDEGQVKFANKYGVKRNVDYKVVQAITYKDGSKEAKAELYPAAGGIFVEVFIGCTKDATKCPIYEVADGRELRNLQDNGVGEPDGPGWLAVRNPRPTPTPCLSCAAQAKLCFSGSSTVRTDAGMEISIRDVKIGDKLQSASPDGKVVYEEIYGFGHREVTEATFIRIELANGRALELTPTHMAHSGSTCCNFDGLVEAREIKVGDTMWATDESGDLAAFLVSNVQHITRRGIFNPLTRSSMLIVNGISASNFASMPKWWSLLVQHRIYLPYRLLASMLPTEAMEWLHHPESGALPCMGGSFCARARNAVFGYGFW